MKDRPILFSAPMVRAILEGRKTQTRRIVKPTPDYFFTCDTSRRPWPAKGGSLAEVGEAINCPYGAPGDRLWVREAWRMGPLGYRYRASSEIEAPQEADVAKWKPSIHMPRGASRITLEVTAIRVDSLNGITEADARAEGIVDGGCVSCGRSEPCLCASPKPDARDAFAHLWESINGKDSWFLNPWVWVVEFRRVEA